MVAGGSGENIEQWIADKFLPVFAGDWPCAVFRQFIRRRGRFSSFDGNPVTGNCRLLFVVIATNEEPVSQLSGIDRHCSRPHERIADEATVGTEHPYDVASWL